SHGLEADLRHSACGGAPGAAVRAGARLEQMIPGVHVVGAAAPPFGDTPDWAKKELRDEVVRTKPHVLWGGRGAPKQELWMAQMAGELDVPIMIGVGAAFDYLAGSKPHAPPHLRHVGLGGVFRLVVEPKRLCARYLVGNFTFLWLLARERLV